MFIKQNVFLLYIGYMCVDFGSADGTVAKNPLDISDINVLLQQKSGKGMPEHMRCQVLWNVGKPGIAVDHKTDGLIGQSLFQPVYKKISADFYIILKCPLIQEKCGEHLGIPNLQYSFFGTFSVN